MKLLDLDPANPTTFTQDDLTGHWDGLPVGRAHNMAVNQELNCATACGSVGGNDTIRVRDDDLPCRGGLIFLDVSDPSNPTSPGCGGRRRLRARRRVPGVHGARTCGTRAARSAAAKARTRSHHLRRDRQDGATSQTSSPPPSFPGAEYVHQGAVNDVNKPGAPFSRR